MMIKVIIALKKMKIANKKWQKKEISLKEIAVQTATMKVRNLNLKR